MAKALSASTVKPGLGITQKFNEAAEKPLSAGHLLPPNSRRQKLKGKRFIITAAQNNTNVNENFLKALETYTKENDAQLMVSRFSYNKTAYSNEPGAEEIWYDPKLKDYFFDEPAQFNKDLVLCGELNISPTISEPLSGLDNYCQGASGIVPHSKFAMKSLPGLGAGHARFLYTTGAVTLLNYIQQKAGQKAEFHHNFGALVVELDDDGNFFVRQLAADKDGSFYDLTNKYMPDGTVLRNQRVKAINLGDTHVNYKDDVQEAVTFGPEGFVETCDPEMIFYNDTFDGASLNHHESANPYYQAKQHAQRNSVEEELKRTAEYLKSHERKGRRDIIVQSNHDLFFERWLREQFPKLDPTNIRIWHESNAEVYRQIENGALEPNILELAVRRYADLPYTTFLSQKDSFVICKDADGRGIETAMHGHAGPNGSRGSPRSFRALDMKANTGHTHAAGIVDGVYTAGVSAKLDMGYNIGPSNWSHSHIITYANGKRAILTVAGEEGKYAKWHADDVKHVAEKETPAAKSRKRAPANAP